MSMMIATELEPDSDWKQSRPFETLLARWKNLLRPQVGPTGRLRWLLRENLAPGRASDDAAVSILFQTFEPALSEESVARVFERESHAGRPVHLELIAAPPDSLLVALASRRSWARSVAAPNRVTMQIEPTFHCFEEIEDPGDWRERVRRATRADGVDDLERILRLEP